MLDRKNLHFNILRIVVFIGICMGIGAGYRAHAHPEAETTSINNDAISDDYIKGYAQAILKTEYGLPSEAMQVKAGVIYLYADRLPQAAFNEMEDKVIASLQNITGVKKVILRDGKEEHYSHKTLPSEKKCKEEPQRKMPDGILVPYSLFKPLIADPKWPRFSVAYHYQQHNNLARHVFAPNFGATLALYRHPMKESQLEIGIQAGLFGIMDIGRSPTALLNADYMVGVPVAYRSGAWSNITRFYHVSSHLGDEFMLTPEGKKTKRINLSYETLDNITSHDFTNGMRLYGGGGYIVHREPNSLKPIRLQAGLEYRHPTSFWRNQLRPLAGLDVKANQESRWSPDLSLKAGVQLQNSHLTDRELLLLLEWYKGHSPDGQFYKNRVQYVGLGIHIFL